MSSDGPWTYLWYDDAKPFDTETEALEYAHRLSDYIGHVEYGVRIIDE